MSHCESECLQTLLSQNWNESMTDMSQICHRPQFQSQPTPNLKTNVTGIAGRLDWTNGRGRPPPPQGGVTQIGSNNTKKWYILVRVSLEGIALSAVAAVMLQRRCCHRGCRNPLLSPRVSQPTAVSAGVATIVQGIEDIRTDNPAQLPHA